LTEKRNGRLFHTSDLFKRMRRVKAFNLIYREVAVIKGRDESTR
jgi:hypothetical protein